MTEREVLLFAVARFLDEEVRPHVKDPRTSFRVLIAAHLARSIGGELVVEEERTRAELAALEALAAQLGHADLGPEAKGAPAEARTRAEEALRIRALTQIVADDVKSGKAAGDTLLAIRRHVEQKLVDELRIINPRFSTAREIESQE
jgi:hypothetical protein